MASYKGKKYIPNKSVVDRSKIGGFKDIVRSALGQGLAFGFGDEVEAFARSLASDKEYEDIVKEIRAEIELFRKENPDHNPETGLKLFINPDLSPGNVEPRPSKPIFKGLPDKRGGYEDWNRLWGATHNPDGTPKQKT